MRSGEIRAARQADVPRMIELAAEKRAEYERAQPVFWRVAPDAALKQTPFFEQQIARENVVALVHEHDGVIDGFLLAFLHEAPPVYAPGGPACTIDDFTVATPDLWATIGRGLLDAAVPRIKALGAAQVIIVCGHHDMPKRAMLEQAGWPIASEWRVRAI